MDCVVPFAMEFTRLDVYTLHFHIGYLLPRCVLSSVQTAGDFQTGGSCRMGNEIHYRFIVSQRLAAPVRRNEGEQAMFYLVPLAGAWRKMADGNRQPGFVRQSLKRKLPNP